MLRYFVVCLVVSVTRASITDDFENFITRHVQNDTCKQHILHVLHAFNNLEMWAVQMVDASAKLQAGILDGNLKSLGHYDQCVESRDHLVTAQYCLVNVHVTPRARAPARITELLKHVSLQRYGKEYIGNRSEAHVPEVLPLLSTAQFGVCVPKMCDTQDVTESVRAAIQLFLNSTQLEVEVYLSPDYCYIKQPHQSWTQGQVVISILVTTILIICIIGTLCDNEKKALIRKGVMKDFVQCFSVKRSWRSLTSPTSNSISCLDGLRVINTFWVIFAHKTFFRISGAIANNTSLHYEITSSIFKMPLSNAFLSVDSFLMISAMLKAEQTLNSFDKRNFNAWKVFFKRFLRLSPAYYFMILIYATVLPHLGNGPSWHKFVHLPCEACATNWFWNLIYSNNYINSDNMCMVQSWYLALDMQLHLIAPLILYATWYFARFSTIILVTTLTIATAVPFYIIFENKLPGLPQINASDADMQTWSTILYFPTHARATSFTVGLGLGYILYKTQNKQFKLNKISVAVGWLLCIFTLILVLFGAFPLIQFGRKYNVYEDALYGALNRPLWAAALAWTVFACHKGYGGLINRFLSSKIFQPFSRLSYCVYLTHLTLIIIAMGNARSSRFNGNVTLAHDLCGDICFTLVFSLILYIMVEAPCSQLANLYFNQTTSKKSPIKKTHSKKKGKNTVAVNNTKSNIDSTMDWITQVISTTNKTLKNIFFN